MFASLYQAANSIRLNALSGIGGVQTSGEQGLFLLRRWVLMPCRALEAFRPG